MPQCGRKICIWQAGDPASSNTALASKSDRSADRQKIHPTTCCDWGSAAAANWDQAAASRRTDETHETAASSAASRRYERQILPSEWDWL